MFDIESLDLNKYIVENVKVDGTSQRILDMLCTEYFGISIKVIPFVHKFNEEIIKKSAVFINSRMTLDVIIPTKGKINLRWEDELNRFHIWSAIYCILSEYSLYMFNHPFIPNHKYDYQSLIANHRFSSSTRYEIPNLTDKEITKCVWNLRNLELELELVLDKDIFGEELFLPLIRSYIALWEQYAFPKYGFESLFKWIQMKQLN